MPQSGSWRKMVRDRWRRPARPAGGTSVRGPDRKWAPEASMTLIQMVIPNRSALFMLIDSAKERLAEIGRRCFAPIVGKKLGPEHRKPTGLFNIAIGDGHRQRLCRCAPPLHQPARAIFSHFQNECIRLATGQRHIAVEN